MKGVAPVREEAVLFGSEDSLVGVITDPVDASVSRNQGIRIFFEDGARIVFRLSGTGTDGATLRIYLERYEPPEGDLGAEVSPMLAELAAVAGDLINLETRTGRTRPDVIT